MGERTVENLFSRILNLSPADFFRIISKSSMLPVQLGKPASYNEDSALSFLFGKGDEQLVEKYRRDLVSNHNFFQLINERLVGKRYRRFRHEG
jgi:hypothetical protein